MSSSQQSLTGSTSAMASQGATASVSVQNNYFILAVPGELDRLLGQGAPAQTEIGRLALEANTSREAVVGFLKILKQDNTPTEKLPAKLEEIANRYNSMMERLAVFDPEDAVARGFVESAHEVLLRAGSVKDYDRAEALLLQASASQWKGIRRLEEFEKEAHEIARRLRRDNSATLAELAELGMTRLHYLQAAEHYWSAARLLAVEDAEIRREYLLRSANALYQYGDEKGDNAVLLQAVERYRELLQETPRAKFELDWAMTQNNLGNVLSTLGEREGGTTRLEEAVEAYRSALEEYTRERVPLDWAMTQNNLGNALSKLAGRDVGTARLEEAVKAYRSALEERTRERVPLNWAATQNNLGTALCTLGERESGTARLEEAVKAYRNALEERTRERVPLDWAMTQNNLCTVLCTLGERESNTARFEEAVEASRSALEEYTRERVPLSWAMTQNNLGNALRTLGEREVGTAQIKEAVKAFRRALEEYTRERIPVNWATTQSNLGDALQLLGEREAGTKRLEEARTCITGAWEVCREEGMSHYDNGFKLRLAEIDELIASRS